MDTIYALVTPMGKSGVAVVRVSGPEAKTSLSILVGGKNKLPSTRFAALKTIRNPNRGEIIDHALTLFFEGPESFTGEDITEYHIHGGPAVIRELLMVLSEQKNHRMADPGEFTRRAFENGKIDLTEAEAIADLVDAQTQMQKAQALSQYRGVLSNLYDRWRENLTEILAHLEADIEFPDEDMPEGVVPAILPRIRTLCNEISEHLSDNNRGERLRDGLQVAVIGAPNAGKSSLVNVLAKRDVAIVSEQEGTTRDIIEVHLDLGGYPVVLSDTAGLRPGQIGQEGQEGIESEGIKRALKKAEEADIRLLVFDASLFPAIHEHTAGLVDERSLVVFNKCEISSNFPEEIGGIEAIPVSAKTGEGLDKLLTAIIEKAEDCIGGRETPSLTRQRHRDALEKCRDSLLRVEKAVLPELMAEDIRLATRYLGRITGRVDVEDLLDIIFKDFCIGK